MLANIALLCSDVLVGKPKSWRNYAHFTIPTCRLAMVDTLLAAAVEPDLPHKSKEWQIWAYSTAAPSFIGNNATVLDHNNDVLRPGTNGWTCMPGNARPMPEAGWEDAHQAMPVCADAESMKWMQAYLAERIPELAHDGFMWMLHGDVGEDNTTPMVMHKADSKEALDRIDHI